MQFENSLLEIMSFSCNGDDGVKVVYVLISGLPLGFEKEYPDFLYENSNPFFGGFF